MTNTIRYQVLAAALTLLPFTAHAATDCQIIVGRAANATTLKLQDFYSNSRNLHVDGILDGSPWYVSGDAMLPFTLSVRGNCEGVTIYPMVSKEATSTITIPEGTKP